MGRKSKQAGLDEADSETSESTVKQTTKKGNASDDEPETKPQKDNGAGKKSKKGRKGENFWDTAPGDEDTTQPAEEEDTGKKTKKDAPAKKGANKKEVEAENPQSEDEDAQSAPKKAGKAEAKAPKKAKKGGDDEDEPVKPAAKGKGGRKKGGVDDFYDNFPTEDAEADSAPKKPEKEQKSNKKDADQVDSKKEAKKGAKDTNESESVTETKAGKAKAKKGGRNNGAEDYYDSLASESADAPVEEKKAKPSKSEKAEKTEKVAPTEKSEKPAPTENLEAKEEGASAETTSKKKKKKAGAEQSEKASVPAPAPAKPEDPKAAKADKRRKQMAELLRAQREELEEKARQAEELRKQKEEEERLQAEQDAIDEEQERIRREQKKAKKKENAAAAAKRAEEQRKADRIAQLAAAGMLPAALRTGDQNAAPSSDGPAADQPKKRVVYSSRKKTHKPKEDKPVEAEAVASPPAEPVVAEPAKPEEPKKDEPPASWDDEIEEKLVISSAPANWDDEEEEPAKPATPPTAPAKPTTAPAKPAANETAAPKAAPATTPAPASTQSKEKPNLTKKEKPAKGKAAKPKSETTTAEPDKKELRSPICCILGHVDTGKTSLLDKIRNTDVQKGEAGGITQQIGATYFPMNTIQDSTRALREKFKLDVLIPGLLIIDTPGHESFSNLRSRGSGLCDIAILVVDIMHLLEPQTIESIKLLQMRKTPYVVALNKVDRLYNWRGIPWNPFRDSLRAQSKDVALEFDKRVKEVIADFAGRVETNAVLYYDNKDYANYVSLVPTSAHTGEGIPDLLLLLVQLTQRRMTDRLYFSPTVQCTVLEVKVTEGLGTTIDVILVNGRLRVGDTIVLSGMNGSIATQIRALKTPQPLRELRVKSSYVDHDEIKAAMGLKIVAPDLEKAVAGSALLVADDPDDVEQLKSEVQSDMDSILNSIDSSAKGVSVQASTLGSLEALLTFLKASKIPVSGVNIGPIHKKDIIRASVMLEHSKEFACILAFDVKIEKEAQLLADEVGVRIFSADIIYHLFTRFTEYMEELKKKRREEMGALAVWPCVLKIKPDCVFMKSNPILVGVEVMEGILKINTPIVTDKFVSMGVVTTIEHNHKAKQEVKKGEEAAIKIEWSGDHAPVYQRHFEISDTLMSKISRESIDVLKELYPEQLTDDLKKLIQKLKKTLKVE